MDFRPVQDRGYANPGLLAETDWLADQITDPKVRVIDARRPKEYAVGHIPGAVNINGFGGIPRAENGDMADPAEFAALAGSLGISNDMTVVVYDAPSQMMGTVAWAFLYYGHPDVRMLDGGLEKWSREHRPVSDEAPEFLPAQFAPNVQEAVYCSLDQAKDKVNRPETVFWDTRSREEFEGTAPSFDASLRPGRIPGAVHLNWEDLIDRNNKTLKPAAELREILVSRGITPESEINTY